MACFNEIVMGFFFFLHLKNGATISHLGSCIELPLAAHTDPGGMRSRCGTKHSISASDITAVSSAVSACAINSVLERVDCLCRKYLTPDPKPWEIFLFALKWWTGSWPVHQSWSYWCLFMLASCLYVLVLAQYFQTRVRCMILCVVEWSFSKLKIRRLCEGYIQIKFVLFQI